MDTDTAPPPSNPLSPPPTSLARRATDLLAISVVLVCGLTAGREIIQWWRTDAAGSPLASGVADPQSEWRSRPLELQFGDNPLGMQRVPFTGTRDAAAQQLLRLARAALKEPTAALSPLSEDEAGWMAALAKLTPEESSPEGGTIYHVPGFLPAVAAVRTMTDGSASGSTSRLVAWGFATPQGDNAWTLMLFQAAGIQPSRGDDATELPQGAERLLAWRDHAGNRVVSFRGEGPLDAWLAAFDRQFGSTSAAGRILDAAHAAGHWQTPQGAVDVQMSLQGEEITGLLWITARVPGHNADAENLNSQFSNSQHDPHSK